jgi:hypothetical protein
MAGILLLVLGIIGGNAAWAAPANDNFADASVITATPFEETSSTIDATLEEGEGQPCGFIGSTVWYRYDATEQGPLAVTTAGSDFDTVVALYSGTSLADLTLIDCNDDAGSYPAHSQSFAGFLAEPGTSYFIQAGGYGAGEEFPGRQGALRIRVSFGLHVGAALPMFIGGASVGLMADPAYQEAEAVAYSAVELFVDGGASAVIRDGSPDEVVACVIGLCAP